MCTAGYGWHVHSLWRHSNSLTSSARGGGGGLARICDGVPGSAGLIVRFEVNFLLYGGFL
jgi:hypothetical protein